MTVTDTSPGELEERLASSALAADHWSSTAGTARALALDSIADALDAASDVLVPIAQDETHLAQGRLRSELKRTTFQLRLFAQVLVDGSYLDVRIDAADPQWPMGTPRPDLRRVLEPLGPVVVFAAGNFPFAFSAAGGDTASALAAGCSVIMKVHPGHPRLSAATGRIINAALESAGAPAGLYTMVSGIEAGRAALIDPRVRAGAFTGSIVGGRALFDLASSRPEPIPFYAEMGSVNPTFVTRAAATARGKEIAEAYLESVTASAGQLCTKPGILLVPQDSDIAALLRTLELPAAARLLDKRIHQGYLEMLEQLASHRGVDILTESALDSSESPVATLLTTTVENLVQDPEVLMVECFGPASLVVTYEDESDLEVVAQILQGQLTATIQGEEGDDVHELVRILAGRAGRLLWNQWPTGLSVTYAQQHGGPYPAATVPGSTSVGTAAIDRFLRPVAYQGFPQDLLPAALQDGNPLAVPRSVDGPCHSSITRR